MSRTAPLRRRALSLAAVSAIALPALAGPTIGPSSGLLGAQAAHAAVVPNMFVRDCSYITRRCTGYHQTNGRYDARYPSSYSTRWVWRPV